MDLDATHEEQEQEQEQDEGRISRHHEEQHFHVLAVDDSQTDRKFLERLLTVYSNYHVTCVDSGDEALKYLGFLQDIQENNNIEYEEKRQSAPSSSSSSFPLSSVSHCHQSHSSNFSDQQQVSKVNLIMTDFSMPGMSGYDLLKRIKESASWKDIPVVVMSSENVPSRINMCLEGGAEDFLLKPVKPSDLKKLQWNLQLMTTAKNNNKSKHEDNMMLMSSNKMQIHHQLEMENESTNNGSCYSGGSMNNNGSSSGNINMAANKRKASLAAPSDRSRPRVVQELPVS